MANKPKRPRRTIHRQPRDDSISELLYRTPATTDQILYVSQTWQRPFHSLRRVQERLADLTRAGWVQGFPYTSASHIGGKFYYQLTLKGYRTWLGNDQVMPPTVRFFRERADARHRHTYALSQFICHLTVAAHRRRCAIENYCPEGTVFLAYNDETVQPDGQYTIVTPDGRRFLQYVEIDRSTKRRTTTVGYQKTWSKCNRVYDGYQTLHPGERFRVIIVTTESYQRAENILAQFAQETGNPNRQLYLGVALDTFLSEEDALGKPIYADHRCSKTLLIPPVASPTLNVRPVSEPRCPNLDSLREPVYSPGSGWKAKLVPV